MAEDSKKTAPERPVFKVAYQPQVRTYRDTRSIMLDVIIALIPVLAVTVWQHGAGVLIPLATSVISAVFFEWAYRKLMNKPSSIGDLSAVVTGLLLGCTLPTTAPWWLPIIGTLFAIVVVKQLYGGIGKNFLNPALAGRAFLLASYPVLMSTWSAPAMFADKFDAVTMATPLSYLYGEAMLPSYYSVRTLFFGILPGCIGELSVAGLLIGFVYLLVRKVISWRIPVSFIGTVAVLTVIFGRDGYTNADWMLYNLFSGGLFLGAIFMATDYTTSPDTLQGQLIYGAGCGILTVLIRYFGGFPEGTTYAILIMNLCTWAIDKAFRRKPFGTVEPVKKGAAN